MSLVRIFGPGVSLYETQTEAIALLDWDSNGAVVGRPRTQ
jgi:hypothetical protein